MADKKEEKIVWDAEFAPEVKTYWLINGAFALLVTVIGIPLIPFWFLFGNMLIGRYLKRMRLTLTDKNVHVAKGVLTRMEKTVPLDKITDMGLVQGPLMRFYGVHAISLETAGQSSAGALIKMQGVKNVEAFRQAVLEQRDKVVAKLSDASSTPTLSSGSSPTTDALLADIRDTLHRIEQRISASQ